MPAKAKLLFVDDEERVVNLLKMMFRATHEVFTATSGAEALEIIAANEIQVIVSDQRMPGMLGTELLLAVRKKSPSTMRILLTGYSDLAAIVGSVNDGEIFRFVSKPWDNAEMKAIVGEAAEIALATQDAALSSPESLPPSAELASLAMPALLVLDDSDNDRRQIMQLFSNDYRVHGAANVAEALKVIEQHDVGVIVSEARVGSEDTGQLLRILKQNYPMITTVMLTSSADSDLIIKMINQAQIFRFAMKPIRAGVFQLAVSAAMKEHRRFRSDPRMMSRVSVAKATEPEDMSLVALVTGSLSRLRARFSFFSR
ncbi:response regulator [Polaromonas sp.]|uniref:response regulator n=1 Tax=Polaromonas sp. TaxID=1869339 RepID=UPI0017AF87EA|nr:response regulator [Polaromonas sp.]NMM07002.1 response regulator [Polaromonas sp.]